ncbi:MAG TPA: hypothetical protein VF257_19650 [Solirubrobacteraceae bacterium]
MRRAGAAALAAAALVLAACGGGASKTSSTAAPPPAKPAPADAAPRGGLAIGLTEINPDLFWHGKDVGAFDPWRDRAEALRPPLYRLVVDWASLQPSPDAPIQWAKPSDGCQRGLKPCRPYGGIRDTLRAIRSQQQAGNGFATMVVFYGVPEWAAAPASGCERPGIGARSRPITDQGLEAYRNLVRSLQDLSRREGVAIRWWSPWNEPNGPFFISPQRARCRGDAKALSPAVYAKLASTMRQELRPGQQMVVGELAGLKNARKYGTSIAEFYEALPDDVVCQAGVFAQHAYAKRGDAADDRGAVGALEDALDRRPCARDKPIWVTETGVGGPHVGDQRSPKDQSIRADCQALHVTLRRWDADPRVDAAFQYTFRDDPVFPVGLVDAELTKEWPAYQLFKAWGGTRRPDAPPPALPRACSA